MASIQVEMRLRDSMHSQITQDNKATLTHTGIARHRHSKYVAIIVIDLATTRRIVRKQRRKHARSQPTNKVSSTVTSMSLLIVLSSVHYKSATRL